MPILIALFLAAAPHARTPLDVAVERYDAAQVHGDAAALNELLADDYLLVNSGSEVENKRQFIADLTEPGYKLEPYVVRHAIERRWQDGAVMGGVVPLKGVAGGKPFAGCLRFVDVWRREGTRWRVAYSQAMRGKPEECAAP